MRNIVIGRKSETEKSEIHILLESIQINLNKHGCTSGTKSDKG